MTEIGNRTADIGIPVAYHNHMNAIGERPEEVDWVLEATDPRYVKVLLDIAHYQQGGGDPVRAIGVRDSPAPSPYQGRGEPAAGRDRRSDAVVRSSNSAPARST